MILSQSDKSTSSSQIPSAKSHPLSQFLINMGGNTEEQIQKNQKAMALLKSWLEEKVDEQSIQQKTEEFEILKQVIDEERPSGKKLFSAR